MANETPEDNLEKKVEGANSNNLHPAASPSEHKEEKKPASTLESVVNEATHGIGNVLKAGMAGVIPYTFASMFPTFARDTAILTGAQVASDYTTAYQRGKKYTAGNLLESAALGTATTPVLETMFRTTNLIPTNSLSGYIAKGAVWGGVMYPAFVASYLPMAYLIRNRTFKGMGNYLKENFWKTLKASWTKLLPFSLANLLFAPGWLQIPISAAISFAYDRLTASPKEEIPEHLKRDKTPYLAAATNVSYKLVRNSVKGLYDAFYAIGSSISDLYKTAPKIAAPSQPAPAGARP